MRLSEPDPNIRLFNISGKLALSGQTLRVSRTFHADDLLEGEAGKAELAERVRRRYAEEYGAAMWLELKVTEHATEKARLLEG